eukprot:TRINITY_DN14940_c0_g1_i1.p1 TRINITY_DN14940_c0_g1~~TRINITY_DN14940_c0_g1_i1.p1  ORF type:complete len:442 (-),score=62.64 TRINITY_DN14940_c0_g1_i1:31-1356(-)
MYLFRKKGSIDGVFCSKGYKFKRPRVPGLKPRSYFLSDQACLFLKEKFQSRKSRKRAKGSQDDHLSSPSSQHSREASMSSSFPVVSSVPSIAQQIEDLALGSSSRAHFSMLTSSSSVPSHNSGAVGYLQPISEFQGIHSTSSSAQLSFSAQPAFSHPPFTVPEVMSSQQRRFFDSRMYPFPPMTHGFQGIDALSLENPVIPPSYTPYIYQLPGYPAVGASLGGGRHLSTPSNVSYALPLGAYLLQSDPNVPLPHSHAPLYHENYGGSAQEESHSSSFQSTFARPDVYIDDMRNLQLHQGHSFQAPSQDDSAQAMADAPSSETISGQIFSIHQAPPLLEVMHAQTPTVSRAYPEVMESTRIGAFTGEEVHAGVEPPVQVQDSVVLPYVQPMFSRGPLPPTSMMHPIMLPHDHQVPAARRQSVDCNEQQQQQQQQDFVQTKMS